MMQINHQNNVIAFRAPYHRGDDMDKQELEEQQRKKSNEKFNSVTNKVKVENQNQTHNVRKEGIAPINQKR